MVVTKRAAKVAAAAAVADKKEVDHRAVIDKLDVTAMKAMISAKKSMKKADDKLVAAIHAQAEVDRARVAQDKRRGRADTLMRKAMKRINVCSSSAASAADEPDS
jgi:hypothetical protein